METEKELETEKEPETYYDTIDKQILDLILKGYYTPKNLKQNGGKITIPFTDPVSNVGLKRKKEIYSYYDIFLEKEDAVADATTTAKATDADDAKPKKPVFKRTKRNKKKK